MACNRTRMAALRREGGTGCPPPNLGWPVTALPMAMVEVMLSSFQAQALRQLAAPTSSFWNNHLGRSQVPCLATLRLPCSEEAQPRHAERLHGETEQRLASPSSSLCPSPGPDTSANKPRSRPSSSRHGRKRTKNTQTARTRPQIYGPVKASQTSAAFRQPSRSILERRQAILTVPYPSP